ncbi:hypothetical protein BTR23_25475 [Alkalihalophilus pseudofirmus]|nr:hypothetical protein BTR23_25475 [Alkalihalophilus pseudofirmus]
MNELGYRAHVQYKQERIKKVYQEVNRKSKVQQKEEFILRKLLVSLLSKKRGPATKLPCCKTNCCPAV